MDCDRELLSCSIEQQEGPFRTSLRNPQGEGVSWVDKAERHGLRTSVPDDLVETKCINLVDLGANFIIAVEVMLTAECLLGCFLAVTYTLLYWKYGFYLSVSMSWNVVSLAVIFPISQGIGMGFKRREQALAEFGNLLAHLRSIWGALHSWTIRNGDEHKLIIDCFPEPEATKQGISELYEKLFAALIAYFDVERTGRARQATHLSGRTEAALLQGVTQQRRHYVGGCLARLQRLVQDLKRHGLPGGEAHRLDQYVSKCCVAFDRLAMLKEYRTPQAFRAFARVYILAIGAMYGPYYMYLSRGQSGEEANLGLAIAFACAIQMATSGLFNVMLGLEDPFNRREKLFTRQLDSVHVAEMLEGMRQQLVHMQEDAVLPWDSELQGPWSS